MHAVGPPYLPRWEVDRGQSNLMGQGLRTKQQLCPTKAHSVATLVISRTRQAARGLDAWSSQGSRHDSFCSAWADQIRKGKEGAWPLQRMADC